MYEKGVLTSEKRHTLVHWAAIKYQTVRAVISPMVPDRSGCLAERAAQGDDSHPTTSYSCRLPTEDAAVKHCKMRKSTRPGTFSGRLVHATVVVRKKYLRILRSVESAPVNNTVSFLPSFFENRHR